MQYLITFRVAQSDESVARGFESYTGLLFFSFGEFYTCILWAHFIDFEIFKTVVVIIF